MMGKISDALEKSEKKPASTIAAQKPPDAGKEEVDRSAKPPVESQKAPISGQTRKIEPVDIKPEDKVADKPVPKQYKQEITSKPFKAMPVSQNLNDTTNIVMLSRPQSFEAEQFRMLRTKIAFPEKGKSIRSIMITSAIPGEGKSFVAANLAICMAQQINDYVLLMECDIRRPSMQDYFRLGHPPGLSEYLSQNVELASLLQKTPIDKLTILPGGKPPSNPSELLSSNRMFELFEEVKSRYKDRYLIVDSPPPKLTAETYAIANYVDAIVVVVKFGSTKRELVKELVQSIGKEKILGIVVNHLDFSAFRAYGYGKYSKYNKYYR